MHSMTMPPAPSFEEYIRSVTAFFVDEKLENEFERVVQERIESFRSEMLSIPTKQGLIEYIRRNNDSIDNIISLLNISEEKFKRIVTMIRIKKGYLPSGDWTPSALRRQMLSDSAWMDEICELLMNGARLEKYRDCIPRFYSRNFSIDATTIGRLANEDDVRRLIMKSMGGLYSNRIGDGFFSRVSERVRSVCERLGLDFDVKEKMPKLGNAKAEIAIPSAKDPRLVISVVYMITTSSVQTDYAKKAENIRKCLRTYNEGKTGFARAIYVNVVDGGGWIARQSDLKRVYDSSDYTLNLKTLDVLDKIIESHFGTEE